MQRKKRKVTGTAEARQPETPAALTDVFISYARADETIARNVAETLRSEGFEVWFDNKIYAGANWKSLLMSTLASAKAVLVIWSERSVKRPWVVREARIALDTNRLVPMKIDDCRLPDHFSRRQFANMHGWSGTGHHPELERLLAGLARITPPSRIDNVRPGFQTGFLGAEIPLPAITGVAEEFRYLHFSVVMNPARRLAWYVAYNMQAHTDVLRGDRWMPDPALPVSFQPHNDHFLGTGLDRGHMVAPMTVSWGTPREAQLANHQTFFWTNTAPQHPDMNRGWWLSVEKWEREFVSVHSKAVGFAGPVLSADDPVHGDFEQSYGRLRMRQNFRLPRRFWKVVVLPEGQGRFQLAAYLLDQESLLKNRVSPKSKPSAFRSTVAEIEAQTGLDFGETLRNAPAVS